VTRLPLRRIAAAAVLLALAACGARAVGATTASGSGQTAPGSPASASVPDADWTRFDFNAQRSGVGPANTGITTHNLHELRTRVLHIDGTVDSSPIQLAGVEVDGRRRDVILVTTTYGRTLAIDARTGHRLWQFSPRDISSYQGSAQITNATPVADPNRRYVYAASPDGLVHKLILANGHQAWATSVTRDATHEKLGTALNISGSSVVVTTGGYDGDIPPYQGHVALIDRATGHLTRVWNSLCSHRRHLIQPSSCPASDSAIWARSGAVVLPGSGRILVATGNGPFNGSSDWGDSVLELGLKLGPLRHWTPTNQQQLNESDDDLGSTAPGLLPGGLAVQGGKAGVLSLLALNRLYAMSGAGGHHLGGALQDIRTPGGAQMLTAPAVWQHRARTFVFVSTGGGTSAYVLSGRRLHVRWADATAGTSPVVAGGLLYVYDPQAGVLRVLNPTNGHTLASLPAAGGHWNSPIVVGGRIVLPTGDANDHATTGELFIYHLPGR
jgi:outer membrane protein assembly factor BamB